MSNHVWIQIKKFGLKKMTKPKNKAKQNKIRNNPLQVLSTSKIKEI